MPTTIAQERPDTPELSAMIDELTAILSHPDYPPTSIHGYSVQKLIDQGVAFFVLRDDGDAAACGGVCPSASTTTATTATPTIGTPSLSTVPGSMKCWPPAEQRT